MHLDSFLQRHLDTHPYPPPSLLYQGRSPDPLSHSPKQTMLRVPTSPRTTAPAAACPERHFAMSRVTLLSWEAPQACSGGCSLARLQHVAPQVSPACGSGCHPPRGHSRSRSQAPCPRSLDGCSARWCPAGKSPPGHLYLRGTQPGGKATTPAVSPGHPGCSQNAALDPQHHVAGGYPHPLEIRRGDGVTDPSPKPHGPPPMPQHLLGGL